MFKINPFTGQLDNQGKSTATLNSLYLQITNNLSDLNNAATARTNLGLIAGGAGDIWVEKAGDTMTGALTISLATGNSLIVDTSTLVVDATNDRVGIGTASPGYTLDVRGNVTAGAGADSSGIKMRMLDGTTVLRCFDPTNVGATNSINFGAVGSGGDLRAHGTAHHWFNNAGSTEYMTILSSGNVGINTAAPLVNLHISQISSDTATIARVDNTNVSTAQIASWQMVTGASTNVWQFFARNGNMFFGIANVADYVTILNTSGAVIIGHSAALGRAGQLFEITQSANYGGMAFNTFSTTAAQAPLFDFNRSKSATKGTQTAVTTNDALGITVFRGSDGTNFTDAVSMYSEVDAAVSAGVVPGRWRLFTANSSGVSTERIRVDSTGNVGIGVTSPTAVLTLKAGTATASTAPLKFTSGTNLTTAEAGAVEYNGTNLFFTRAGTTREGIITESAVNSVSPTSPNRTITVNIDGTTYYLAAKTTND